MTDTTAPRRADRGELRFHAIVTSLVMTGALALSYNRITAAIRPVAGGLAWLYAVTLDLSMLVALREVTRKQAVARGWAWAVLVLAGGASLGLNTWHAFDVATVNVPTPAAVAFGAGPVALAALLSHLVALQTSRATRGNEEPAHSAIEVTANPYASDPATRHDIEPRDTNAADDAAIRRAAVDAARQAIRDGQRLSGAQLAVQFDRSESWDRARLREARSADNQPDPETHTDTDTAAAVA